MTTQRQLYATYFLKGASAKVRLECFEISHPNFSKTYYVCRNCLFTGIDVTHEDASNHHYDFYPMKVTQSDASNDLDNSVDVSLGDIGQVFPLEFDRIDAANGWDTAPTVKYRLYRSDVLTTPMFGPSIFEARDWSQTPDGVAFTAKAPELWLNRTGEIYTLERFRMLGAFV